LPPFASALLKFLDSFGRSELYDVFIKHFGYGTADVLLDGEEVVAAIRWNVKPSGGVADVLDLFISPRINGVKALREMKKRGRKKFPGVKYIKFVREFKYRNREPRLHKIGD
jgi:hypothetical protein